MGVQIQGDTGNVIATKGTYSGNVTIGGTLTYEDVTNIDSVGLITARNGIEVGARPGVAASVSVDGNAIFSGITTIGGNVKVGTGITLSPDGDAFHTGVVTATSFKGDGSQLSNITSTTINSNAANRVILGSDTANTLNGESNLTFSSNTLTVHEASLKGNQLLFNPSGTAYIDHSTTGQDIQFRTSVSSSQDTTGPTIKSTGNIAFAAGKGIDFSAASGSAAGSTSALLDDYEEGTYNAFITNGMDPDISSNSGAYSIQTGFYRKIGTLVEFNFFIRVTNNSAYESDGGAMRFSLPFSQDSTNYHKGHGLMSYTNINNPTPSTQTYSLYISGGSAQMYSGQNAVSGGNGTGQNNRDFIGGGHFYTT